LVKLKLLLERVQEAVEISRQLFIQWPSRHDRALASTLGSLANRKGDLGRSEEALLHAREAHGIFERLAKVHPERHEVGFAISLNNLASHLSNLGRFEEGLSRAREAHVIYERLARARPDKHDGALADSLNNVAALLSNLGRLEEGLSRAREAHMIYERLAKARPDRFDCDLAMSLHNLASHLSESGLFELALDRSTDAYVIRLRLAKARPNRYESDLADTLGGLARHLSNLGLFQEGFDRIREVAEIDARLAKLVSNYNEIFDHELLMHFLAWHLHSCDKDMLATWLERSHQVEIPVYLRQRLEALYTLLMACIQDEQSPGGGTQNMELFVTSFEAIPPNERHQLELYRLIATGYQAQYVPSPERTAAFDMVWRSFLEVHGNRIPPSVTETLRRLNCALPRESDNS